MRAPVPGGVVFVGSSSIRLWDGLERQLELADKGSIIKRGFGGSLMSDCRAHVARLVLPYKPRLVIVYAGDNDLAEGRTPVQVRDESMGGGHLLDERLGPERSLSGNEATADVRFRQRRPLPPRWQLGRQSARGPDAHVRRHKRSLFRAFL